MTVYVRVVAYSLGAEDALRLFAADTLRGVASRVGGAFNIRESRVVVSEVPFVVEQRLWVDGKYSRVFDSRFEKFANGLRSLIVKHMDSKGVSSICYGVYVQDKSFDGGDLYG